DSGIEGVRNNKEAVPLLKQIIKDQRALLSKYRGKPADSIPQVFTAYKEMLDIYDNGLKVPDDITLVWPDDNYGYISRLNNNAEQKRSGGSGVYYHASYWGRPHDYLWIGTTPPRLMKEELMKALKMGADKIWVLNVGDIKPLEFSTDYFFRLAYDPYTTAACHFSGVLNEWVKRTISNETEAINSIASTLMRYYREMYARKPEFMGWSRTEPTTQTSHTEYNHFYNGDEARARIHEYDLQEEGIRLSRAKLAGKPGEAAFYQLAYYPVVCASWMNKKFLYRDKAIYYAKQNRLSALDYAALSRAAYDSIVNETAYYNNTLSAGKWKNMMSMNPRDLPVFKEPVIPQISIDASEGWSVAPEGFVTKDSSLIGDAGKLQLPVFYSVWQHEYFIDIFLCDTATVNWTATANEWIKLFRASGSLSAAPGKKEQRTRVSIDWSKAPADKVFNGKVIFKGGGKQIEVMVQARRLDEVTVSAMANLEVNGHVTIDASRYAVIGDSSGTFQWKRDTDMGRNDRVLSASLPEIGDKAMSADLATIKKEAHIVEYHFYTFTPSSPIMTVFSVPAHPVNNNFSNRYAVSVDDGPLTLVDFKTEGRSEEWKKNVLSNRAKRNVQLQYLDKGLHKLRIYCVDPGVMLEEIHINLAGLKQLYGGLK
ncbi:MAG TPA: glycosyl hydrolase 115 family protein, partial [Niastella sp.]|nr:glycosyl hydrolase 115 family protein [Niastella sp.]